MAKITFKSICKDIVSAQIASDAGKHISDLYQKANNDLFSKPYYYKYRDKSFYLLRAIQQIDHTKFCGVRYYVSNDTEFGGCIVYFQVSIPGYKYTHQASFHVPGWDKNVEKIKGFEGKTRSIRWDEKSSRESCFKIIRYFNW